MMIVYMLILTVIMGAQLAVVQRIAVGVVELLVPVIEDRNGFAHEHITLC
jgi:hypothetical protein